MVNIVNNSQIKNGTKKFNYILVSPVYNEEKYIRGTIESVIKQTLRPVQWVIVSDNSTDHTENIVKEYLKNNDFITLVHFENPADTESNLGKVSRRMAACINEGMKHVKHDYDFIGNLDGDVTFEKDYYEKLIKKFIDDNSLGLGGGFIYNIAGDKKWPYFAKTHQVGGPIQFFRKECWEQIGGYFPGGHLDYFAVMGCKKYGWKVQSFPEIEVLHHKNPKVVGKNLMKIKFHLGRMDYVCGELFIYTLARAISQLTSKPLVIGSCSRIAGYLYSKITRTPKQVPPSLKEFLKEEQLRKLIRLKK